MVLQLSYHAIFSLLLRKDHVTVENARLFEKHGRVEAMLDSLREGEATDEEIAFVGYYI